MKPPVSVIIPTYEDWSGLQLCLDCLARQSIGQDRFEVIVANNNASPEVPPSLRLSANARVIHAAKPGSYAARNVALREAQGDILFFTDSDCLPDSRWIEAGLARISELGPTGRVAGAVQLFPKGANWTGPELYDRIHSFDQKHFLRNGWGVTANLVVRRDAFDLAGPFGEDQFSGGDRVWNVRATKLGCPLVFSSETIVLHPARASFSELAKRRKRLSGGRFHEELNGNRKKRWAFSSLFLFKTRQLRRILLYPGLSDREYAVVLWIAFRLGLIAFFEILRLRYLSEAPKRS